MPAQAAFRLSGGDGCISVTANVVPVLCGALHRACDEKLDADIQWYEQLLAPLHAALFLEANPIPLKRALHRLGLMGDGLRLPLTPLSPDAGRKLDQVLQSILPVEEKEAARFAAARHQLHPRAACGLSRDSCLPRLTGEVARRAGGGRPQSGKVQISDLKFPRSPVWPSPSAPFGGTSPV